VQITDRPAATMILNNVQPGTPRSPRVYYLRLFADGGGADISWLTRRAEFYTNDHTPPPAGRLAYPWILGGRDVSTPTRATFENYQAEGYLRDMVFADLVDLYKAEGILIGSGMENRPQQPRDPSFQHILEGGIGLFTPHPQSMGYKRLMFTHRPAYQPVSEAARNAAETVGVQPEQPDLQPAAASPPDAPA
jgi:hypothetical protein